MRRDAIMHPGAQAVKEATLQHCNVASCNRTYREISKAAASKSVCKPVATPKVSKGRSESPLVASAEAKPCETEKARRPFSLPSTRNPFFVENPSASRGGPRRFPKGDRKALWSPPQRRNPAKQKRARNPFSLAIHKEPVPCERFRPPAGGRGTFPARESTQRAPQATYSPKANT